MQYLLLIYGDEANGWESLSEEEQGEIFPAARKAGVDAKELAAQLAARRKEIARGETPKLGNDSPRPAPAYPFPT